MGERFSGRINSIKDAIPVLFQPEVTFAMSGNKEQKVEEQSYFVLENSLKIAKINVNTFFVEVQNGKFAEISVSFSTSED